MTQIAGTPPAPPAPGISINVDAVTKVSNN